MWELVAFLLALFLLSVGLTLRWLRRPPRVVPASDVPPVAPPPQHVLDALPSRFAVCARCGGVDLRPFDRLRNMLLSRDECTRCGFVGHMPVVDRASYPTFLRSLRPPQG